MAELLARVAFGGVCLVMAYVLIIMLLDWGNIRYELHRCGCLRIEQNSERDGYWCRESCCARHVTEVLGGPQIETARIIVTTMRENYHG